MGDDLAVRYRNTVLIDDDGERHLGNFLIEASGEWRISNGDEDVQADIEGSSLLLTRTFQNWHTHLGMQLNARDFSDGYPLHRWLDEAIFPTEARLTPEYVKVGASSAVCELIRTGSSFAADMYFYPETSAKVISKAGIRALLGGPISDIALPSHPEGVDSAFDELDGLLATNGQNPNFNFAIATHSIYLCSEETLCKAAELAQRHGARLHIHVSETRKEVTDCHKKTGMYPIEYLNSIDFFKPGTICAHASWVKKNEIALLKKHEATAVHCPSSNMKLATGGTMSYPVYRDAGVDVRIGTDGAGSSGSGLDMRAESRLASLIQRHDHWDATLLSAKEVYRLATKGSQDWAAWNLDDIRMRPKGRSSNRHLANLIYSNADCIDMWVGGQAIRRGGKTLTMDEVQVMKDLEIAIETYYSDLE